MSQAASNQSGFLQQNHFIIRRLHSLTGIVPIGVFLIAHLVTNSSLTWGRFALRGEGEGLNISEGGVKYFQHEVSFINTQVPHLLLIEITLWAAIAFHSILGIYYAKTGVPNTGAYKHADNWRYTLQRLSGYFGIAFIFYHVATLRWGWTFLIPSGTKWDHHFSASTLAAAIQGSSEGWTMMGVVVSLFYFIGVSLLVFHFANGMWTAALTWGLTVSAKAQKRWGMVCAAMGAGLMFAAWSSLAGALMIDYDQARAVESNMIVEKYGEEKLHELQDHGAPNEADAVTAVETDNAEPEG